MASEVKKNQVPAPSVLVLTVQGIAIRKILTFLLYKTTLAATKLLQNTEKPFLLRNMRLTQQHKNIQAWKGERTKSGVALNTFLCWDLKLVRKMQTVSAHDGSVPAMEASLSSNAYYSHQLTLFLILFLPFPSTCVCPVLFHDMKV